MFKLTISTDERRDQREQRATQKMWRLMPVGNKQTEQLSQLSRQVETLLPVPPVPSTLSALVLSALLQSKPCHAKRWTRGELLWQIHFHPVTNTFPSCDKYISILWQIHFHLVTNTIWSQLKIYPHALFSAKLFNSSESQVICCWGSVSVSQLAWLISSDCEDWQSVFICFGSIRSSLYSH